MSLVGLLRDLVFDFPGVPDDYKSTHTFLERQDEARDLLETKSSSYIPVSIYSLSQTSKDNPPRSPQIVCEKLQDSRSIIPSMPQRTFALPPYVTVGSLLCMIRFRLKLSTTEALFIFVHGTLAPSSAEMRSLFEEYGDEDGWLYVIYATEDAFGGN